ncbi:MAG: FHA domain-containing protein [Anaerolineales bacterium]
MLHAATGRRIVVGLILGGLALAGGPAFAQGQLEVRISELQTRSFPDVSVYLSVFDASGRRVSGLPSGAFSVIEDQSEIAPEQVQQLEVGTRQVFLLDTSAAMGVRDSLGRTRFDFVRSSLLAWWRGSAASSLGIDDLSLLTSDGVLVSHSSNAAELSAALAALEPTFPDRSPDLSLLLDAFTLLAEPGPRPGMPAAVVFVTPAMSRVAPAAMENALFRADEANALVYFVVASGAPLPNPDPLLLLAQETGGSRIDFDPEVGLTALADRLIGQRTQYVLDYSSRVQSSGVHAVEIRVAADGREAASPQLTFSAEVHSPSVTFVRPPGSILRTSTDPTLSVNSLPPTSQALQVLVTFEDGSPRPVTQSQLLVDGQIEDQRTEPPFERFEWDLTAYPASGQHVLQVVVWDSLGLQGSSEPHTVDVRVEPAPGGLVTLRRAVVPLAIALGLLILGAGAATRILALGRSPRRDPKPVREPRRRAGMRLQPFHAPEAWLTLENGDPPAMEPFPLAGVDVIVGRDPSVAGLVLEDASVSGWHASLIRQADGEYLIRDQGSEAGTWVNYDLVPEPGRRLEHGDLLQVGRVSLRFKMVHPRTRRVIRAVPLDPTRKVEGPTS